MSLTTDGQSRLRTFLADLKRRRVYRVAVVYGAVAWGTVEIADTALPRLGLPDWTVTLVVILALLGFPIALVLAWAFEVTPEGVRRTEPRGPASPPEPAPRRRALVWTLALAATVTLGTVYWIRESPSAALPSSSTTVAVLPFEFHGRAQLEYLGEGMVHLLSRKLDGAGTLRKVDPYTLLTQLGADRADRLDAPRARELATALGADLYIRGTIVEAGGRLEAGATLYDAEGELRAEAEAIAQDESEIFVLVDALARQLLVAQIGPGGEMSRVAALTTNSVPALKAYLEGEAEYVRGAWEAADRLFERAIAEDSLFALAYYRRAWGGLWYGQYEVARGAAARMVGLAGSVPSAERPLLLGLDAYLRGAADEAEGHFRQVAATYPEHAEAWYGLAETLFHYNGMRGRAVAEAEEPFRRVDDLVPGQSAASSHFPVFAARRGDRAGADSLLRRFVESVPPMDWAQFHRVWGSCLRNDPVTRDRDIAGLADVNHLARLFSAFYLVSVCEDLEGATHVALLLTGPERSRLERGLGAVLLAHVEAAGGRWRAATQRLERAGELHPALGTAYVAYLTFAPLRPPLDEVELAGVEDFLARWEPDTSAIVTTPERPHAGVEGNVRDYLHGLLNVYRDRPERAEARAEALGVRTGPPGARSLPRDLAGGIRAQIAWQAGDATGALAELEAIEGDIAWDLLTTSGIYALTLERWLRARALQESGRPREALSWFRAILEGESVYAIPFIAPAHLEQARIHEELGDRAAAREHYRRFLALWRDADPELRPPVEEARRRLEALKGPAEPGSGR